MKDGPCGYGGKSWKRIICRIVGHVKQETGWIMRDSYCDRCGWPRFK